MLTYTQPYSETDPFCLNGGPAPTAPRSQSAETLKTEKKLQADEIRQMRQDSHEEISKATVRPRRMRDAAEVLKRGARRLAADASGWLAALQSMTTEYRRAEAVERAAALRETVRQRREALEDGQMAAVSELDRQRTRSAFVEQTDRRALSSAREQRANADRQAAMCHRDERRLAAEFQTARRQNAAFADDVARRIGACSKAHVRFVQLEQQDWRRQLAAAEIRRQREERRQRDEEREQLIEERRLAVATQADADRCVNGM